MSKIALIDDEVLIGEQFSNYFSAPTKIELCFSAASIELFYENYNENVAIDVLFLDINLLGISGLEALSLLKERLPNTDIVIFRASLKTCFFKLHEFSSFFYFL